MLFSLSHWFSFRFFCVNSLKPYETEWIYGNSLWIQVICGAMWAEDQTASQYTCIRKQQLASESMKLVNISLLLIACCFIFTMLKTVKIRCEQQNNNQRWLWWWWWLRRTENYSIARARFSHSLHRTYEEIICAWCNRYRWIGVFIHVKRDKSSEIWWS